MSGLCVLRDIAREILPSSDCHIMHEINGDSGCSLLDCSGRTCFDCCSSALLKVADQIVGEISDLESRYVKRGFEWPRFEDGERVALGDCAEAGGSSGPVAKISFYAADCMSIKVPSYSISILSGDKILHSPIEPFSVRVKRAAPKVLDADGVEIRVGDTVYLLPGDWCDKFPLRRCREWDAMKVINLSPNHDTGRIGCGTSSSSVVCYPYPSQLTHRAPVFAADGKPLREGEHVYHVETGAELVVKELPKPGEYQAVVVFAPPASHLTSFDPDQLTHERPDSWEWLDEDVEMMIEASKNGKGCYYEMNDYVNGRGVDCPDDFVYLGVVQDVVRRAKKLAGVESDG